MSDSLLSMRKSKLCSNVFISSSMLQCLGFTVVKAMLPLFTVVLVKKVLPEISLRSSYCGRDGAAAVNVVDLLFPREVTKGLREVTSSRDTNADVVLVFSLLQE